MIFFISSLLVPVLILGSQDNGISVGYLSECPGMNKSTVLSQTSKNSVTIVVINPTIGLFDVNERRCRVVAEGAQCVASFIDLKMPTQVMISGYLDTSYSPAMRHMAKPYLNLGRNVLFVETFPTLFQPYPIAARVVKPLGELLGEFLAQLSARGLSASQLELMGASLGAHIASFAAVRYRQLTGLRPARLSALDAAGPCFRKLPPSERLNPEAAERVDALHTNMDGFGISDPIAQVDFYANGGEYQQSIAGGVALPCLIVCSHVRAAFYWMYAYKNPDKFVATRCDSVASARKGACYDNEPVHNLLGPMTNFSRPGIYYLPTTASKPYYVQNGQKRGLNAYLFESPSDMVV